MAALSLSSLIWLLLIIILFSTLEHSLSKRQQLWIPTTLIMTNKNDYLSVREAYSRHSKENMNAVYIRVYVCLPLCCISSVCRSRVSFVHPFQQGATPLVARHFQLPYQTLPFLHFQNVIPQSKGRDDPASRHWIIPLMACCNILSAIVNPWNN